MPSVQVVNPDAFLETPTGRWWTPERGKEAWFLSYQALENMLAESNEGKPGTVLIVCGLQGSGKSSWIERHAEQYAPCICFDAALPGACHRQPIIQIAQRHAARIIAIWIDAALDVALQRNALRRVDEKVPDDSILSVAKLFEAPTIAEGFAEVIRIKNG